MKRFVEIDGERIVFEDDYNPTGIQKGCPLFQWVEDYTAKRAEELCFHPKGNGVCSVKLCEGHKIKRKIKTVPCPARIVTDSNHTVK